MFELIFTVVVLWPGSMATINETMLSKHTTMEDCLIMKQMVMQKLITDPPKTPTYLDCRKARYDKH
jgi:hypothetical protein